MRTDPGFSEKLLKEALKRGASLAEVYQRASKTLSVDVRKGEVESVETSTGFGYSLRVINRGKLGFSYSNSINEFDTVLDAAFGSAEFTGADEFLDLPEPVAPETPEVFDPEVEAVGEERGIRSASIMEQSCVQRDDRIKRVRKASASFSTGETMVINSRGVSYRYPSTSCSARITVAAEEDGDSQMGWDFQAGRFLEDVSFEDVGSKASERALAMLGARRIGAVKSPVLLESLVASEFLSVFAAMLSAESVQKGKSLLKGKTGQRVASELLDVIDDGLLAHGPGTRHVDDEGVPARRKELIREGVLTGFMHNTHTARKDNTFSTGNALRGGVSSPPSVGPLNLFISPAREAHSPEAMLGGMDKGLYIMEAMGIHTADPISGDFSIGVSGLWVENGRPKYPVKEAVISGNLLDFFGNLYAVGSDLRFYGGVGSPSLLMGPTDISA